MRWDPGRHYVTVEHSHGDWEGVILDELLDLYDDAGDPVYKIEADGANPEQRRVTHDRRKVILSCSKEHADRIARDASTNSQANAKQHDAGRALTTGTEGFEAHELPGIIRADHEVGIGTAIKADLAAQAQAEALMNSPGM